MSLLRVVRRIRSHQRYEQAEPYLFGVVAACACIWWGLTLPSEMNVRMRILGSSISAGSIMFGFLATSLTLLLSFEGSRKKAFDRSGFTADIVRYVNEAIYIALAFTIINLAGYFICSGGKFYMSVWLGFGVTMFGAFHRVFVNLIWLMRES